MAAEMVMAAPSQLPQYACNLDLESKYQHKEMFYKEFENFIQNTDVKRQAKCVIRQDLYDKSLACLKSPRGEKYEDCRLKSWAKSKFILMNVDGKESVYCAKTRLPIVTYENMFDTIDEAHNHIGHHGRDKTRDEVAHRYSFIPYKAVEIYVKSCQHCSTKGLTRGVHRPPPGKPPITMGFMTRVQVELLDLRSRGDGKYAFILHLKDHFSKYCWLFAIRRKEPRLVTKKLLLLFSMFGSPRILQCDGGSKDFFAEVLKSLKVPFPGMILRNGRLRYPQLKGLEGRSSNDDIVKILCRMMEERGTDEWSKLLADVMTAVNNYTTSPKKKTSYEIVFGQKPQHYEQRFYDVLTELDVDEAIPVEALLSGSTPTNQNLEQTDTTTVVTPQQIPVFHQLQYGAPCYSH